MGTYVYRNFSKRFYFYSITLDRYERDSDIVIKLHLRICY